MIDPERKARVRQGYPHFVIEDACKNRPYRRFDLAASQGKKLLGVRHATWQSSLLRREKRCTLRDGVPPQRTP